jgi:Mycothiol maleylpyruvate isomerase N-terminal domain
VIARLEATAWLAEQRAATLELIAALPPRARTTPGLDGGEWSPKDLLGHLESWERHALDALDAWARDEPAPVDAAFRTTSLSELNRRQVERKARRSYPAAASSAARTHRELLDAIAALTDEQWERPATSRGRKPLGHRLGQILVGAGPFGHDAAHHKSLVAFARLHARP